MRLLFLALCVAGREFSLNPWARDFCWIKGTCNVQVELSLDLVQNPAVNWIWTWDSWSWDLTTSPLMFIELIYSPKQYVVKSLTGVPMMLNRLLTFSFGPGHLLVYPLQLLGVISNESAEHYIRTINIKFTNLGIFLRSLIFVWKENPYYEDQCEGDVKAKDRFYCENVGRIFLLTWINLILCFATAYHQDAVKYLWRGSHHSLASSHSWNLSFYQFGLICFQSVIFQMYVSNFMTGIYARHARWEEVDEIMKQEHGESLQSVAFDKKAYKASQLRKDLDQFPRSMFAKSARYSDYLQPGMPESKRGFRKISHSFRALCAYYDLFSGGLALGLFLYYKKNLEGHYQHDYTQWYLTKCIFLYAIFNQFVKHCLLILRPENPHNYFYNDGANSRSRVLVYVTNQPSCISKCMVYDQSEKLVWPEGNVPFGQSCEEVSGFNCSEYSCKGVEWKHGSYTRKVNGADMEFSCDNVMQIYAWPILLAGLVSWRLYKEFTHYDPERSNRKSSSRLASNMYVRWIMRFIILCSDALSACLFLIFYLKGILKEKNINLEDIKGPIDELRQIRTLTSDVHTLKDLETRLNSKLLLDSNGKLVNSTIVKPYAHRVCAIENGKCAPKKIRRKSKLFHYETEFKSIQKVCNVEPVSFYKINKDTKSKFVQLFKSWSADTLKLGTIFPRARDSELIWSYFRLDSHERKHETFYLSHFDITQNANKSLCWNFRMKPQFHTYYVKGTLEKFEICLPPVAQNPDEGRWHPMIKCLKTLTDRKKASKILRSLGFSHLEKEWRNAQTKEPFVDYIMERLEKLPGNWATEFRKKLDSKPDTEL